MSGFIGVVSPKLTQVDSENLDAATVAISKICTDYSGAWKSDCVDLRFGWLKTFDDTEDEHLPFTIDDNIRIVGDVRLDNRHGLIEKLQIVFSDISLSIPDSYLMLYAYKHWGENCLQHIAGDYAFAIWNELENYLFCARDHFGLVPFYYAQIGDRFLFTNFYTSLKDVPNLTEEINDEVLRSYLETRSNQSVDQTIYKNIKKLPPANQLVYKDGVLKISTYWEIPKFIKPIRYKTTKEYVEHFYKLFKQSVKDRTRHSKIASSLSGGMDSSAITATAKNVNIELYGTNCDVRCYNIVYEHLVNEKEGFFAEITAKHLNLPINQYVAEDFLKNVTEQLTSWLPEPVGIPNATAEAKILSDVEAFSRTYLTGFGGDPLFMYDQLTSKRLKEHGGKIQCYKDEILFYKTFGRFSGTTFRHKILSALKKNRFFKAFISTGKERFLSRNVGKPEEQKGAKLFYSYSALFENPFWSSLFETSYPGFNGYKVKVRQPFVCLDLFLFILALPPHLLYKKSLLRLSMIPFLPIEVVARLKAVLFNNPYGKGFKDQKIIDLLNDELLKPDIFFKGTIDFKSELQKHIQKEQSEDSDRQLLNILQIIAWKNSF